MNIQRIKDFLSETHQEIDGWFFPLDQLVFYEIFSIQNSLNIDGDVAEIGVYKGKSLVLLSLLKSESQRLLGFDLFDKDYQEITEQNLSAFGTVENVALQKGLTSDLSRRELDALLHTPLRFLHIDAGHEYFEVLEQLELFVPFVSDQGIIAMDDYQDREFPGIEAAVLDFSERDRPRRFVPFLSGGNKMFLCCATVAASFQKIIVQQANFRDRCRLTRVKDFNILVLQSKLPVSSDEIETQITDLLFPQRPECNQSLNQRSRMYSQLEFGSGVSSSND